MSSREEAAPGLDPLGPLSPPEPAHDGAASGSKPRPPSESFRIRPDHPYATRVRRLPEAGAIGFDEILPGTGPREIEIGPGRGGFAFERVAASPTTRLLGLEIRLKWAAIVDERLVARGLGERARVFNADAREVLQRFGPDASVAVVYLHFPDPWWKKRHEKRLVMGDTLLEAIVRLLADGGELFVQTDVEERAGLYDEQIRTSEALEPAGDAAGSALLAENPYGARSPREHRAIEDGLPVHRLRYRRRARTTS